MQAQSDSVEHEAAVTRACILDYNTFPIIVDLIIAFSSDRTRIALWALSKALHDRLNRHYYNTFAVSCKAFTTPPNLRGTSPNIPPFFHNLINRSFPGLKANLERYRVFDVYAH